jgi:hypothetical protein
VGGKEMATYTPKAQFFGKINNTNPTELNKQIDYNKTKLEDRKQVVNEILDSGFYEEYFDEFYKVNVNSSDTLSEFDNASNSLERMANYLLNSDEAKEEKKDTEYKFYNNEDDFQAAIAREAKIDNMSAGQDSENVIHFLKKENRNFKKTKTQFISSKDLQRDDELGEVLRNYQAFLSLVTENLKAGKDVDVSRYLLTKASGALKQDMIMSKDILLGVFGYRTNATESTVIEWDEVDYCNPEHVKALLHFDRDYDGIEDLKYIIIDFYEILDSLTLTELQQEILELIRRDKTITDIARILKVTRKTVYHNIDSVVNRVCNN